MNMPKKEKYIRLLLFGIAFLLILIFFFVNKEEVMNRFHHTFIESNNGKKIGIGLFNTILISVGGLLIGIVIGVAICLIQGYESQNSFLLVLKQLARFYVSLFRGTPVAVQLLIIYFILFANYNGSPTYIALLAFGLNSGAYVSEIIRGGIASIPVGQMEAGRSLGLSYWKVMKKIIFPQAMKNVLPALGNEFVSLIKETSVAGFIGAVDLTLAFRQIANGTFDYEMAYLVMGITYFAIVLFFTFILKKIERRLSRSDRTETNMQNL